MKLIIFASGSTGNCALIQGGGQNILLDAGISARRICDCLEREDVDPAELDGIFITHEHTDHVSGLTIFTKQHPTAVYAPGMTADALRRSFPGVHPFLEQIALEQTLSVGNMTVTAFPTSHDAAESVGYRFEADGAVLTCATDTGCVTDLMLRYFEGADAALIEANHDLTMLMNGHYPAYLKKRILSDKGHLSNAECTWLAAVLAKQGTGRIVLGHLSRNNNIPGLARRTVGRALQGYGTELFVAPAFGRLAIEVEPCSI